MSTMNVVEEAKYDEKKAKKFRILGVLLFLSIMILYGGYQYFLKQTQKTTHTDIVQSNGISVPFIYLYASQNVSHIELRHVTINGQDILNIAKYQTIPTKFDFDTLYTETVPTVSKTDWVIYNSLEHYTGLNKTDGILIVPPNNTLKLQTNFVISIQVFTDDYFITNDTDIFTEQEAVTQYFNYLISGLDYGIFWMADTLEVLMSKDDSIEDKTLTSGDMHFTFLSSFTLNYLQLWQEVDHTTPGIDSIYFVTQRGTHVNDLKLSRIEKQEPDFVYRINLEFVEVLSSKKYVLTTDFIRGWTDTISDTLAIANTLKLLITLIIGKFIYGINCKVLKKNMQIYAGYAPNYYILDYDMKRKIDVYLAEKELDTEKTQINRTKLTADLQLTEKMDTQ
eukprot:372080_1